MAITWGGTSLPNPSQYPITYRQIGSALTVASGAQVFDIIAQKMEITLTWNGITTAEKDSIVTKATAFSSASLVLTNVGGPTVSVIPQPGQLTIDAFGVTPAWNVTVTVCEV